MTVSHVLLPDQVFFDAFKTFILVIFFYHHEPTDQIVQKATIKLSILIQFHKVAIGLYSQLLEFFIFTRRELRLSFELKVAVKIILSLI